MVRLELLEEVVAAKKAYKEFDMKSAGEHWSKIYDLIEQYEKTEDKEKVMREYHNTMILFSNDEVYGITDFLKKSMGY